MCSTPSTKQPSLRAMTPPPARTSSPGCWWCCRAKRRATPGTMSAGNCARSARQRLCRPLRRYCPTRICHTWPALPWNAFRTLRPARPWNTNSPSLTANSRSASSLPSAPAVRGSVCCDRCCTTPTRPLLAPPPSRSAASPRRTQTRPWVQPSPDPRWPSCLPMPRCRAPRSCWLPAMRRKPKPLTNGC